VEGGKSMSICCICARKSSKPLCPEHSETYIWEPSIQGFRRNKKLGSRYTTAKYHGHETTLVQIIEDKFGKNKVITQVHPIWAISEKGVLLEYDIHIKGTDILIEYNGIQHYTFTEFFHHTKNKFKEQLKRDKLKAQLAKDNNYNLIIFSHDEPIIKNYVLDKIESETGY